MSIDPIIEAVRDAVKLCQEIQHNSVQGINKFSASKNSSEPVTVGDYGAQTLIGRALMQHFPHDAVIAEESGSQFAQIVSAEQRADILQRLGAVIGEPVSIEQAVAWLDFGKERTAPRTWVIDPIDGTKGFIAQRHYAICVGLLENHIPTGGVMGCPYYNEGEGAIFFVRDGKMYRDSLVGGDVREVRVSQRQNPQEWVAVQSWEDANSGRRDAERVLTEAGLISQVSVKSIDSMEKYALVGAGDADMMIRLPNKTRTSPHMVWDHVAGIAMVLAGGGVATDFNGEPLDFSQGKTLPNQGMIVSSGIMHAQLVAAAIKLG
jgi:3'(2'), 5'-bisphosphate nucleotidase